MFAAIIVFWEILYVIADRFGFKEYDEYPTLMIIGTIIASIIGGCVMPYKPAPLVILGAYSKISGTQIDFLQYILFSLPVTMAVMILYLGLSFCIPTGFKGFKAYQCGFCGSERVGFKYQTKSSGFIFRHIYLHDADAEYAAGRMVYYNIY